LRTPVIFNPRAGRGKLAPALKRLATRHALDLVPANDPEQMRARAAELAVTHSRLLVAGGDGTVHHAIRGIEGSSTILGIVAAGTGNDFACALNLPLELEPAIERGLTAPETRVDLGRVGAVPFAGIAGIGIVADVLTYLEEFTRRYRGNWVYPWAVLRTVLTYRALDVAVESDDEDFRGPAMMVVAANAPRFGGGMRAAPEASMQDGLLDVVILSRTSRTGLIRLLPRVYRGTHLAHPACRFFRASEVRFTSDPGSVVYADGEALPETTASGVTLRIDSGSLRVAR
jgi:diacylglycerol kinase (ATP)